MMEAVPSETNTSAAAEAGSIRRSPFHGQVVKASASCVGAPGLQSQPSHVCELKFGILVAKLNRSDCKGFDFSLVGWLLNSFF